LATIVDEETIQVKILKQDFRRFILRRDKYTCQYCGDRADTVDHMKPVSKGGLDTPQNCVAACTVCNQVKGKHNIEGLRALKLKLAGDIDKAEREIRVCDLIIQKLEARSR